MELMIVVGLGIAGTWLAAKCFFSGPTPRQIHSHAMREAYQELRSGRQIDRSRSEYTANQHLAGR